MIGGVYRFSVFIPEVLIILNIVQIMYLIIGVYNTKTEPKNFPFRNLLEFRFHANLKKYKNFHTRSFHTRQACMKIKWFDFYAAPCILWQVTTLRSDCNRFYLGEPTWVYSLV